LRDGTHGSILIESAGRNKMTNRVTNAIARSISHNEIAHIDGYDADYTALIIAADDSVMNEGILEAWGTDEDGAEWRVHARMTHLYLGVSADAG
jgi:hypothetical protein